MKHTAGQAEGATVPRFACFIALSISLIMAAMTVVLFLAAGAAPLTTWLLPPLLCSISSFAFALRWPAGSWRWGVWLSFGFWAFFVAVFFSYLLEGTLDCTAPARAALVLAASVVAAVLGAKLRRGRAMRRT